MGVIISYEIKGVVMTNQKETFLLAVSHKTDDGLKKYIEFSDSLEEIVERLNTILLVIYCQGDIKVNKSSSFEKIDASFIGELLRLSGIEGKVKLTNKDLFANTHNGHQNVSFGDISIYIVFG